MQKLAHQSGSIIVVDRWLSEVTFLSIIWNQFDALTQGDTQKTPSHRKDEILSYTARCSNLPRNDGTRVFPENAVAIFERKTYLIRAQPMPSLQKRCRHRQVCEDVLHWLLVKATDQILSESASVAIYEQSQENLISSLGSRNKHLTCMMSLASLRHRWQQK